MNLFYFSTIRYYQLKMPEYVFNSFINSRGETIHNRNIIALINNLYIDFQIIETWSVAHKPYYGLLQPDRNVPGMNFIVDSTDIKDHLIRNMFNGLYTKEIIGEVANNFISHIFYQEVYLKRKEELYKYLPDLMEHMDKQIILIQQMEMKRI